ncbi:MAG: outer-membrane lipoprotein carrier protein LolA [Candidatus Rickettsia vulgarisii]
MKNLLFKVIIALYFVLNVANAEPIGNKEVAELKQYISAIKSIAVDFTQEDLQGKKASGKLLINKPYKFRCNYYPPFPLVIIGNSNSVSVYDYDMKHVSRIKTQENVFNFLLEDNVDFNKNFKLELVKDSANSYEITIYHNLAERGVQITFNKTTKQIKMFKIFEDDNVITLTFNHIEKVKQFDDDLFKLKSPEIFGTPDRLTKSDIEKKYTIVN